MKRRPTHLGCYPKALSALTPASRHRGRTLPPRVPAARGFKDFPPAATAPGEGGRKPRTLFLGSIAAKLLHGKCVGGIMPPWAAAYGENGMAAPTRRIPPWSLQ